jgi:hypothetical protein
MSILQERITWDLLTVIDLDPTLFTIVESRQGRNLYLSAIKSRPLFGDNYSYRLNAED